MQRAPYDRNKGRESIDESFCVLWDINRASRCGVLHLTDEPVTLDRMHAEGGLAEVFDKW